MNISNTRSKKPNNALVGVVKMGYLKKNKSLRKKFFVLREATPDGAPARLEYYVNRNQWKNNTSPKYVTVLKTCFKIDKQNADSRIKKPSIRLYTCEKYFFILFDSEQELDEWLNLMLVLRVTEEFRSGDFAKECIENIWYITVLKKDLGFNPRLKVMTGFSQSEKKFTIMKYPIKSMDDQDTIDIMLTSIRHSGYFGTYFYFEVGPCSPIGPGYIWIDIWNPDVAKSLHDFIMGRCASNKNYKTNIKMKSSTFNGLTRKYLEDNPLRKRTVSENTTSSTRSPHGILSPKQTFHNGRDNASALSSASGSGITFFNSLFSKSSEITDSLSSLCIGKYQQPIALTEKPGDFVSFTPLDREENIMRQTMDHNVHNINLISNDFIGYRPSSSQSNLFCDSSSLHDSPISVDDQACAPFHSGVFETISPPDGYLPMKPSYTLCNHVSKGIWNSTKQILDSYDTPKMESPDDNVPMAPVDAFSDHVPMDGGKLRSIKSGTPSTDARFSHIHLEKVTAYLSTSKEKVPNIRTTRTHSVGSESDGFREKIERISARRQLRPRALTVGSHSRPSRLSSPNDQSGLTSMSQQSSCGDHMEIDYSSNSKCRRHYVATSHALSGRPPTNILYPSSNVSHTYKSFGHFCLPTGHSTTFKRVLEVSSVDPDDDYVEMKPGVGLIPSTSTNMALENATRPPVREAEIGSISVKQMVEDLNRKLNSATSGQNNQQK